MNLSYTILLVEHIYLYAIQVHVPATLISTDQWNSFLAKYV